MAHSSRALDSCTVSNPRQSRKSKSFQFKAIASLPSNSACSLPCTAAVVHSVTEPLMAVLYLRCLLSIVGMQDDIEYSLVLCPTNIKKGVFNHLADVTSEMGSLCKMEDSTFFISDVISLTLKNHGSVECPSTSPAQLFFPEDHRKVQFYNFGRLAQSKHIRISFDKQGIPHKHFETLKAILHCPENYNKYPTRSRNRKAVVTVDASEFDDPLPPYFESENERTCPPYKRARCGDSPTRSHIPPSPTEPASSPRFDDDAPFLQMAAFNGTLCKMVEDDSRQISSNALQEPQLNLRKTLLKTTPEEFSERPPSEMLQEKITEIVREELSILLGLATGRSRQTSEHTNAAQPSSRETLQEMLQKKVAEITRAELSILLGFTTGRSRQTSEHTNAAQPSRERLQEMLQEKVAEIVRAELPSLLGLATGRSRQTSEHTNAARPSSTLFRKPPKDPFKTYVKSLVIAYLEENSSGYVKILEATGSDERKQLISSVIETSEDACTDIAKCAQDKTSQAELEIWDNLERAKEELHNSTNAHLSEIDEWGFDLLERLEQMTKKLESQKSPAHTSPPAKRADNVDVDIESTTEDESEDELEEEGGVPSIPLTGRSNHVENTMTGRISPPLDVEPDLSNRALTHVNQTEDKESETAVVDTKEGPVVDELPTQSPRPHSQPGPPTTLSRKSKNPFYDPRKRAETEPPPQVNLFR